MKSPLFWFGGFIFTGIVTVILCEVSMNHLRSANWKRAATAGWAIWILWLVLFEGLLLTGRLVQ